MSVQQKRAHVGHRGCRALQTRLVVRPMGVPATARRARQSPHRHRPSWRRVHCCSCCPHHHYHYHCHCLRHEPQCSRRLVRPSHPCAHRLLAPRMEAGASESRPAHRPLLLSRVRAAAVAAAAAGMPAFPSVAVAPADCPSPVRSPATGAAAAGLPRCWRHPRLVGHQVDQPQQLRSRAMSDLTSLRHQTRYWPGYRPLAVQHPGPRKRSQH